MKYALNNLERCAAQVKIGDTVFGGGVLAWIAGPCAVESLEQMRQCTSALLETGIRVIRAGLYKPRTSPYSFQGLGNEGTGIIRQLKKEFSVSCVSEAVDEESLQTLLPVADAIQIGARNCLNYALLKQVGRAGKPVILKRGFSVTMEEYLCAAEYLALNGCREIILCERGIRTVTEVTRFTLDVGAIAWLKAHFPLPVTADPSHAAGDSLLVAPLASAAVSAGADGLMIECCCEPERALCDNSQQLTIPQLKSLKKMFL